MLQYLDRRSAVCGARRHSGPQVEAMESRRLLSQTLVVNTLVDQTDPPGSATVSLRDAITQANSSSDSTTITFANGVSGSLQLVNGQLEMSGNETIAGPSAHALSIDGQAQSRVFQIDAGGQAEIDGLTITNGYAGTGNNGGAILNNGTLTLARDVVSQSTAGEGDVGSAGALGGGIYNAGTLVVRDSTISTNVAGAGGQGTSGLYLGGTGGGGGDGGGLYNAGTLTLINSTISGNTAGPGGLGGIGFSPNGLPTTGGDGGNGGSGGGLANAGAATLVNDTFSENTSGPRGPGGYGDNLGLPGQPGQGSGFAGLSGTLSVGNTISAGNFLASGDASGSITSLGHNLIGQSDTSSGWVASDQTGTADTPLDARLAPLAIYGGSTPTYALMSGSPAIDTGDNALVTQYAIATDQRGLPRIFNSTVDIGAYEVQPPAIPGDVNHDGTVNLTDFLLLARNFGNTSAPLFENGDLNGDGVVNLADLLIVTRNFGRHATVMATANTPLVSPSDAAGTPQLQRARRRTI